MGFNSGFKGLTWIHYGTGRIDINSVRYTVIQEA